LTAVILVRYDDQLDEFLDEAYERFVTKRDGSTKQRKRAKRAYTDGELLKASSFQRN